MQAAVLRELPILSRGHCVECTRMAGEPPSAPPESYAASTRMLLQTQDFAQISVICPNLALLLGVGVGSRGRVIHLQGDCYLPLVQSWEALFSRAVFSFTGP